MRIEIYIWCNTHKYYLKDLKAWRTGNLELLANRKYNLIIVNHRFKEYRKNFNCTNHQLVKIIKKSKTIKAGNTETLTI